MKFSIIITVTNPRKSINALESALAQNYNDYEIIYSNNSGNSCKEIIKKFKSKKIKYYETRKYLRIVDHWNFAFSKASGEWQILLCDDDALMFNTLGKLNKIIEKNYEYEIFIWNYGFYKKGSSDNSFHIKKEKVNSTKIIKSKKILDLLHNQAALNGKVKLNCPFFPRAVFSKKIISQIEKKLGFLFLPPDPMTSSAVAGLKLTKEFLKINETFTILDVNEGDNAASHIINNATFKRMHRNIKIKYSPIKTMHNFPSTNLESLIRVEKKLGQFDKKKINFSNFFFSSYLQIQEMSSNRILQKKVLGKFNEDFDKQVFLIKFKFFVKIFILRIFKLKLLNFLLNFFVKPIEMQTTSFDKKSNINFLSKSIYKK